MASPTQARYGEWVSPITSAVIVADSVRLSAPLLDRASGDVFWVEGRPTEAGRCVLCRRGDGDGVAVVDVSPAGMNVRTRVHEYGGGEALVRGGVAFFSNFADQRLYRLDLAGADEAVPLTPAEGGWRFADAEHDAARQRLLCVAERHNAESAEPQNCIVAVPLSAADGAPQPPVVLAQGRDFYASPRLSPDGSRLAFVSWQHPNMPWDDTQLFVADVLPDGTLAPPRCVAGAAGGEAVMQPRWSPTGELHYLSDASNFWNLYAHPDVAVAGAQPRPLCARAAEFGAPAWLLGQSSYDFLPDGRILCAFTDPDAAGATLALLLPEGGAPSPLATPFTELSGLSACALPGGGARVSLLGGRPDAPTAVAVLDVPPGGDAHAAAAAPGAWAPLRSASRVALDSGYVSLPRAISFPAASGSGGMSWLYYYPPTNEAHAPLPGAPPPPLLVKCHGGPTSSASTALNLTIQYWTSRGFAVADVNYGGSSGYGRAYRQRLAGKWGIVDVEDACGAARHLASAGLADAARLAIDGGSAGGYTVLAALAFRPGVFSAGASLYGICDLEALATDTHKFESRYLDGLIGPYPAAKDVYVARSPLHAASRFAAPLALFQGTEDRVVPPNQARAMFDALKANGLPCALVLFEGEQHGFRQAPNIRRALDGELSFFGRVFGFDAPMPPDVAPNDMVNL
jgi:dipeptidyl aminopeptidase/acylaminoacyl peptidase